MSIFRVFKQIPSCRSDPARWRLDTAGGFPGSVTIDLDASPFRGYRGIVTAAGSANLAERLSGLIGFRVVLERPSVLYRALGGIRPGETVVIAAENGTRRRFTITNVVRLER